jgi:hypothetical protein
MAEDTLEPTCPCPGGCRSCPDSRWCALQRMKIGITTLDQELETFTPKPYPPVIAAMVNWSELNGVS